MEILPPAPLLGKYFSGTVATRCCTEALKISKDFTSREVTCAGLAESVSSPICALRRVLALCSRAKCCTQSSAGRGDPTKLWDKGWCQSCQRSLKYQAEICWKRNLENSPVVKETDVFHRAAGRLLFSTPGVCVVHLVWGGRRALLLLRCARLSPVWEQGGDSG